MLLGMHTFCLNLHGIGQSWAGSEQPWARCLSTFELFDLVSELGLDGIHLDDGVLERLERPYLQEVGAAAAEQGLYLEYNFSRDMGEKGVGYQHDLGQALEIADGLGADVVKMSMDMRRPRPVAASRFHPDVVAQMETVIEDLRRRAPRAEELGLRIAVENHADVFSEELLWLLDEVDHPNVGACLDTANALHVTEDPSHAAEMLAPRAFTNHFRDDRINVMLYGFRYEGCAVGDGDLDMKRNYELIRTQSPCRRINIETDMDVPTDDRDEARRIEREALERSIRYCRDVLGVRREEGD